MGLFRKRRPSDDDGAGDPTDEDPGLDEQQRPWQPGQPIAPREARPAPGSPRRMQLPDLDDGPPARLSARPLPDPGQWPRLGGRGSAPVPDTAPLTPPRPAPAPAAEAPAPEAVEDAPSFPPAPAQAPAATTPPAALPRRPVPAPSPTPVPGGRGEARPPINVAPSFRPRLAPDAPEAAPAERLPVPGHDIVAPSRQGMAEEAPGFFQSPELTIDDVGVTARRRAGLVEQVTWEGLIEVAIRAVRSSTIEGAGRGQFWLLGARNGSGVVVPAEGAASDALLQRLQRLPAFDNRLVAKGLSETGDRLTVVWRERS